MRGKRDFAKEAAAISAASLIKLPPSEREARVKAFEDRVARASRTRSRSEENALASLRHAARK